ncbi:MAG: hypothetical protein JRF41_11710 [Deltaproteobacteria bacterium]|nr:hypothetical protein [Deltaproteobacteria bacterium]
MSASISVLLNYAGRVYVSPRNARPDIFIDSVETRKNEMGRQELVIICMNRGTGRGNLLKSKLIVTSVESGERGTREKASVELGRVFHFYKQSETVCHPLAERSAIWPGKSDSQERNRLIHY